jgi:4'-phosphopantetheinyl transferase EntD
MDETTQRAKPIVVGTGSRYSGAMLAAMAAGLMAGMGSAPFFHVPRIRTQRRYPAMAVSPPEEIRAWNAAVDQRKAERTARRIAARDKA